MNNKYTNFIKRGQTIEQQCSPFDFFIKCSRVLYFPFQCDWSTRGIIPVVDTVKMPKGNYLLHFINFLMNLVKWIEMEFRSAFTECRHISQ